MSLNSGGVNKVSILANGNSYLSGGNLGIGLTGPTHLLQLNADDGFKPNGGSWGNSSDQRLKTNIQPISDALDKVTKLQGVKFDWRNPQLHGGVAASGGFIAQDVAKVFPEFVSSSICVGADCKLTGNGKAYTLSLPFTFDAYIVEAIKGLKALFEEQSQRMQALEAANDNQAAAVKELRAANDNLRREFETYKAAHP
jgi:hypothetical protein